MLSLLASAVVTGGDFKLQDVAFLTGSWTAEIWGGVFEEVWLPPKSGTMVSLGRHTTDEKTTFMESAALQKSKDGVWTLYMILGSPANGTKTPIGFELKDFSPGKSVTFVNLKNEFPTHITYSNPGKNKMQCVISGRADGKAESETFDFKRAK
jgi:hypothetical protein